MVKSKEGAAPPPKGKLTWIQALQKWNQAHSTAMWCVPRKYDPQSGPGWVGRTTPASMGNMINPKILNYEFSKNAQNRFL